MTGQRVPLRRALGGGLLSLAMASAVALGQTAAAADPGDTVAERPAAASALFSADGYRIDRYRRPTPDQPPAGQRIDTAGLALLIQQGAPLLVDVHAATLRPESAELGSAWLAPEGRMELPGSVWLPNVGQGRLSPLLARYLADNLARLTAGNPDRPLVFYCVVDCWMSWNAVKRAASLGYRNLYWYPEGSDGWGAAGLPLVEGEPIPLLADPAENDPAGGRVPVHQSTTAERDPT